MHKLKMHIVGEEHGTSASVQQGLFGQLNTYVATSVAICAVDAVQ